MSDKVQVVAHVHPFAPAGRLTREIVPGKSLAAIVAEVVTNGHGRAIAAVDGEVVGREAWGRTEPGAGALVTIRVVPAGSPDAVETGSAKGAAWSGLMIVAGAAIALIPGGQVFGAALFYSGVVGLIGSGATFLGAAIAKQNGAEGGSDNSAIYSIRGGRNQAKPWGKIPVIFGKHLVTPYYAARPYTEISGTDGEDQYLRMLFLVGYGPLRMSTIKIGETLVSLNGSAVRNGPITDLTTNYDGVSLQVYQDGTAPSLYPISVLEDSPGRELPGGTEVWLTTAPNTDLISVDITLPRGLYQYNSNGAKVSLSVNVQVRRRAVGSGTPWASCTVVGNFALTKAIAHAIRYSLSQAVTAGQYEVGMLRVEKEDSDDFKGARTVQWTAFRSIRTTEAPVDSSVRSRFVFLALRIKASKQLSGVVDQLNCIAEAEVPTYSGSGSGTAQWALGFSRNPAAAFLALLRGNANPRAITDNALIDWPRLESWFNLCATKGWTCDGVETSGLRLRDALQRIAETGRASLTLRDGLYSVVVDEPKTTIVQHFTPRNVINFSWTKAFRDLPHALKVGFVGADDGYSANERIVCDDSHTEATATKFERIDTWGITDKDLAWKHGRYKLAVATLRPEVYSFETDPEGMVCEVGDLVAVSHDSILVGLAAGRVKAVNGSDITVDETLSMEAGKSYAIRFRRASDNASVYATVTLSVGDNTTITIAGASFPGVGDLFTFGEAGIETARCLVVGVETLEDLGVRLHVVDEAPGVHTADSGSIPSFVSRVSRPENLTSSAVVEQAATIGYEQAQAVAAVAANVETNYPPKSDLSGVISSQSIYSDNYAAGTSGFSFNYDGTFEFNKDANNRLYYDGSTLKIKGTIEATLGNIGGIHIESDNLHSSNYQAGVQGFKFDNALGSVEARTGSIGGIHIESDNLHSSNYQAGVQGFKFDNALGSIEARTGSIGGWALGATALIAGSGANTVGIDSGGTNPAFYAGSATPSSAPFRVTNAGALTATSGSIGSIHIESDNLHSSNYVAGTSGFKLDNSTGGIEARTGVIGGFTLGSTSLTAGTGSNSVGLDSGGTNPAFYAGSSTPSSAPFRVSKDGTLYASSVQVSGTVNSTSGSVGGWILSSTSLDSATNNPMVRLDKANMRVAIVDSTGTTKVALGYLNGLPKTDGSGNWSTSDYGLYVYTGMRLDIGTAVSMKGGDFVNTDYSFKVFSSSVEKIRLGTDTAIVGLHLYDSTANNSIYNTSGNLTLKAGSTYTATLNYSTGAFTATSFAGKITATTGTGSDSNVVYIKDSNNQLKERTINSGIWNYNFNQELLTTSTPTFAGLTTPSLSMTSGTATGHAIILTVNSRTTGSALSISSTSTQLSSSSSLINVSSSGSNANSSVYSTGISSNVANTGTSSTNHGFKTTVSGATSSYGLYVDATGSTTATGIYSWAHGATTNYTFYGSGGTLYNDGTISSSGVIRASLSYGYTAGSDAVTQGFTTHYVTSGYAPMLNLNVGYYGMGYLQAGAGYGGVDTLAFHFNGGTVPTNANSVFMVNNGGNVYASGTITANAFSGSVPTGNFIQTTNFNFTSTPYYFQPSVGSCGVGGLIVAYLYGQNSYAGSVNLTFRTPSSGTWRVTGISYNIQDTNQMLYLGNVNSWMRTNADSLSSTVNVASVTVNVGQYYAVLFQLERVS